jgi:hypothetical protein
MQKRRTQLAEVVRQNWDIGDPAVVMDRHVHILTATNRVGPY